MSSRFVRWQLRHHVDDALFALLPWIAHRLPQETFHGVGGAYLSKYLLHDSGKASARQHLHFFHRGDEDQELHSHPWLWGVSLILAGGYEEERRLGNGEVVRLARRPGDLVVLGSETFHRVDLLDQRGCWTLFVSGPVVASWGFWHRASQVFTPWRQFIDGKGLAS